MNHGHVAGFLLRLFFQTLLEAFKLGEVTVKNRDDKREGQPQIDGRVIDFRRLKEEIAVDERRYQSDNHQAAKVLADATEDNGQEIGKVKIRTHLPAESHGRGNKKGVENNQGSIKMGGGKYLFIDQIERGIRQNIEKKAIDHDRVERPSPRVKQQIRTDNDHRPSQPDDRYFSRHIKDCRGVRKEYGRYSLSADHEKNLRNKL